MTHPPARKSLGQHFLVDESRIRDIVGAVGGDPGAVVEIGPGRGALTAGLAEVATSLLAIEKDTALAASLRERYRDRSHVRIVEADALDVEPSEFPPQAHLVGNLPYNAATAMLLRWMPLGTALSQMVVMVQREVADRLLAPEGDSARGRLSVAAQLLVRTERLFDLEPGCFRPAPAVFSTVLRMTPRAHPQVAEEEREEFLGLVRRAFAGRRKTLRNNLPEWTQEHWGRCAVDPARRAQTLSVEEFVRMFEVQRRVS